MNHPAAPPTSNPNNRLSRETSPYLLQHQHNPVDWHAWGEDALAEAKASNRPILLSVGYAACHWCHVMAHESFEDVEIAAQMNRLFVNIKIDREERPDLDAIYQQALALLGQQGGWPLTMFLLPDGKPFWGGTYFPKEARYGRPGFGDVLNFISETYHRDTEKVLKNVAGLAEAMGKLSAPQSGGEITLELTDKIVERLLGEVDFDSGGIGGAPKFPQAPLFNSFWRAYKRNGNTAYKDAVTLTLIRMAQGGIYDHLGGGLARYATDAHWLVPHFEKMLYDNAEFIALLTLVWQETRDPLFEARVRETVAWLEREMLAEADAPGDQGGNRAFAASLDADSDGEEGKFYVWTEAEIDAALGAEADFFKRHYDVTEDGNWEGQCILNRTALPAYLGAETEARLAQHRQTLLARRAMRIRPGWDDKVLVDWNGSMIAALAEAAQVFKEPRWLKLAQSAFAFIRGTMFRRGRLFHAWRKGKLAHPATLDDHANLAQAALALYEASGERTYLEAACEITGLLDLHYWDGGSGQRGGAGGYFMTADDTADVVIRPKSAGDNATPNGNGTMVGVLARLHHLTGERAYIDRAHALVAAFAGEVGRNFFPLATLLNNNDFLHRALQVVVVGNRQAKDTQAMIETILAQSLPNRLLQVIAPTEKLPEGHPASGKTQIDGKTTAYLCKAQSCGLPIDHPAGLKAALALG